jgi:hypothetical protein
MRYFLIDIMVLEGGSYVCNVHNIVEKYFSISIAPVQSRGGSLVVYKTFLSNI